MGDLDLTLRQIAQLVISINNIDFHFGSRTLYEGASLHIKPKDRIGLIGANGTGKSTLLRLIDGEYLPDGGTISKAKDCTIGFLNQDLLSYQSNDSILLVAMQAFERALIVHDEIEVVLKEMETNYTDELLERLTSLQEEYDHLDGYTLQSRAEEILEGLGFSTSDLERPLKTFSGGWRMRVMLAKLLLQKPSLLMLDEPTNHLDLPSIKWIEEYLSSYEGAIIVVSHDRAFLDNTVTSIAEVSGGKINEYSGNYSFYVEEKALRAEIQKNAFNNQQQMIRQTERFIDRFKAKASKARQVQSRVKMLDKIDMIDDVVDENARVNFKFNFNTQSGRHVADLEDTSKAYGDLRILAKTNAKIERGDKIALIGANGKGKSTLLRILNGTEPVDGKVVFGHNVIRTMFAQHQLESLNVDNTILEELKQAGTAKTEMELRGILGCFLFSSDDVFKKIKVLSGGEKSRVALAKTLISEANFLLLDEPTNHLDMISVNILIQALQQYEGTFVVISHDRYFVSNIANKIWYIEDKQIKEYPGTYDEYEYWNEQRIKDQKAAVVGNGQPKAEKQPQQQKSNTSGKSVKDAKKQLEQVESNISNFETTIAELEKQLADPESYNDQQLMGRLGSQLNQARKSLEEAMLEWEELAAELETIGRN